MTDAPRDPAARTNAASRTRIIDAAVRCLVREGAAGASMSTIAAAAGVSKALLHYHFADRTRLLTEALTELTTRTIARERVALDQAPAGQAVDALWAWLADELARGELRALLELSTSHDTSMLPAVDAARERRRRAATRTVELVFAKLGLTPRIPTALLGAASLRFIDGLVIDGAADQSNARASFDVFWLALLGLVV